MPIPKHPATDVTLKDPNCVFQLMKKHFSRYDIDTVCRITGTPKDIYLDVIKTFAATGKERQGRHDHVCHGRHTAHLRHAEHQGLRHYSSYFWETWEWPAVASTPCAARPTCRAPPTWASWRTCCRVISTFRLRAIPASPPIWTAAGRARTPPSCPSVWLPMPV